MLRFFRGPWTVGSCWRFLGLEYPLGLPNIAMAGRSPFLVGNYSNTSTQSGSIFQPAMLDDPGVYEHLKKKIQPKHLGGDSS